VAEVFDVDPSRDPAGSRGVVARNVVYYLCAARLVPLRIRRPSARAADNEVIVDSLEAQARATIAAALIVSGAVEIPTIPSGSQRVPDAAGERLRGLTDYVYRLVTIDEPQEANDHREVDR
jgi:hypothetical protein